MFGVESKAEYALTDKYAAGVVASYDNGDAWFANNALVGKGYGKMNFAQGDIVVGVAYQLWREHHFYSC